MDATAVFMLIAFVLRPLVVLMQQHLEVAGDGFETRQSMQEAFRYMVDGGDAGEGKERVHRHGLMAHLKVFEERCQSSALDMMQEARHWIILPPHVTRVLHDWGYSPTMASRKATATWATTSSNGTSEENTVSHSSGELPWIIGIMLPVTLPLLSRVGASGEAHRP